MNSYANRGKALENLIEIANGQYRGLGIAYITKIPTPTKILKDNKGFYCAKSTVDFVGTIKGGKFICFDAKQTDKKRFSLYNVHTHQYEYMQEITYLGGTAFIIVNFSKLNEYYRLDFEVLKDYWQYWKAHKGQRGAASIPKLEFRNEIKAEHKIVLNYLKGVI